MEVSKSVKSEVVSELIKSLSTHNAAYYASALKEAITSKASFTSLRIWEPSFPLKNL